MGVIGPGRSDQMNRNPALALGEQSEGVIAGGVSDPPAAGPLLVRKPAFAALSRLATLHDSASIRPLASLADPAAYRSR